MSLPARHTHRPHCLQPREHGFKLPAYFRYYRIHLNATLARWANLDGLADFNGRMKWPMNVDLVGEILLVALDRLQHLIRRCEFPEILRRIEGDLLCEVGIGKLLPAAHPFLLGNIASDNVREDGCADSLDAGGGIAVPFALQPFLLQWSKQPVNKAIQALA